MNELRLVSEHGRDIRPIIEAALENEMRLITAGVRKTEHSLKKFEDRYEMDTRSFVSDYEADRLEETLDFMEWIGEFRMLERLRDKLEMLRGIRFED